MFSGLSLEKSREMSEQKIKISMLTLAASSNTKVKGVSTVRLVVSSNTKVVKENVRSHRLDVSSKLISLSFLSSLFFILFLQVIPLRFSFSFYFPVISSKLIK